MVRAAVAGQPGFTVDDREIAAQRRVVLGGYPARSAPRISAALAVPAARHGRIPRACPPGTAGARSSSSLTSWWRTGRAGRRRSRGRWAKSWSIAARAACTTLHSATAGLILVQAVTQLEIASTDLRALLMSGRDLRYLVPEPVRDLILRTGCYAAGSR